MNRIDVCLKSTQIKPYSKNEQGNKGWENITTFCIYQTLLVMSTQMHQH